MNRTSARRCRRLAVLVGLVGGLVGDALGTAPRQWVSGPEDLATATASQVAVSARGWITAAPLLSRLGLPTLPGEPPHIWAIEGDGRGGVFLGTGPEGRILRVTADGRATEFYRVEEPLVTALALLDDGDLLAAAAPGGRIHRIRPDGQGQVWSQIEAHYVWSLRPRQDAIFAGTGDDGRVLRLDADGVESPFWHSGEAHIVSLESAPAGGWVAGSAERGRLHALDADGNAFVLHDDALSEVTAVVAEADGDVVAAVVAGAEIRPSRPVVRLRIPGSAQIGAAEPGLEPGLEERDAPIVHGIIEGLPEPDVFAESLTQSRVIRLSRQGALEELWRSTREGVFALARDGAGRILFGTGEPGRLYRVEMDGDVSLLATFDEAQVTGLHADAGDLLIATSNPGAIYRMSAAPSASGSFVSRPIDAGAVARWGGADWTIIGSPSTVTLSTRSGNSQTPDDAWSAWSTAKRGADTGVVDNPDGRYLQWRVEFDGDAAVRVAAVGFTYETHNRAPEFGEFRRQLERGDADRLVFRWAGLDPDGDPLEVILEAREIGGGTWSEVARGATPASGRHEDSSPWDQSELAWETGSVTEGTYELRAWLSDERANPAGESRRVVHQRGQRVTIDRTPPRIAIVKSDGDRLEVSVIDEHSSVTRLELVMDGRVVRLVRPLDGLCDSRHERFRIDRPAEGPSIRLRAHDAAGRSVESELPPP